MKKILVIGSPGAGKTTFCKKLAKRTHLPLIHLDQLSWLPGWNKKDRTLFDKELKTVLETEKWIIDGNYRRTLPTRLQYADTIIWLRFSRWTCLWGATKRMFGGIVLKTKREDPLVNCPEKMNLGLLWYVWRYQNKTAPIIEKILENNMKKDAKLYTLYTRSEINSFLKESD